MDLVAESNDEYSTHAYWEKRYSKEDGDFDWFKSYDDIKRLINGQIQNKDVRVLVLGCGNSSLSADMSRDGYREIVSVDYSATVIDKMTERYADHHELQWHVMDVRDLRFGTGEFDVAIDKGTMDAMMAVKGDVWNPPQQVIDDCTKEVDEVLRVLRPGGIFLYLTFGQPHFRR